MPMSMSAEDPAAERWHGDLLALDPGVRSPGVALFRHGCLLAVDRIKLDPEWASMEPAARWLRIGNEITAWWLDNRDGDHYVRTFVYELPQIYSEKRGKSKGDPNKLLGLLGVGQSVATIITAFNISHGARPPELLSPQPAEWTGQLPKTVGKKTPKDPRESPRGARIWSRLEPAEQLIAGATLQHDAFDGIGLGLHALKRYGRSRIFPGAV